MPTKRTPAKKTPVKKKDANSEDDNAAALGALIHLRGTAQGKVTRIRNALMDGDQPELNQPQVKVYLKKLESAYAEFNDLHQRIVEQLSPDEREEHDQHYLEFDALHDEVSLFLETWLENISTNVPDSTSRNQPVIIQQSLPRIIPSFDGCYEQWEKFKVMFRDVVDKSSESPRIKLYHLEKALVGNAAGLLDAKTISDGNYEHAWKLLEERYEDKRRLIDLHIGGLLGIKKCGKESHIELRTLVEKVTSHIENLKFLGQEFTGISEQIVVYLIAQALDEETKKAWESTVKRGELPSYETTIRFLKDRVSVLERCDAPSESQHPKQLQSSSKMSKPLAKVNAATVSPTSELRCEFCDCNHLTFKCQIFNNLSVGERLEKVREKNVCFNCLRRGHRVTDCQSKRLCAKCQRKHHTLLHHGVNSTSPAATNEPGQQASETPANSIAPLPGPVHQSEVQSSVTAAHTQHPAKPATQVVLLTALVDVLDADRQPHPCRALLDCGSQVNFLSHSLANVLNINVEEVSVPISGIGSVKCTVKQRGTVQVRSRCTKFSFALNCLISPNITGNIPPVPIEIENWNIPSGIKLADPCFNKPDQVDMLIGMEMFYELMQPGYLRLSDELPILHNSHLGWIIGGRYRENMHSEVVLRSHVVSVDPIEELVQKFWEVEGLSSEVVPSTEAEDCERHFQATHRRDSRGRFIVQLPLKDTVSQLKDSRSLALRRFYLLESKLIRQPDLKFQYDSFMDEYESLGHCKEVKESNDPPNLLKWYLPHHAVLRPGNSTTKCRVVFDGSAKINGYSLNDALMVGPTVQSELLSIILCFRKYRYVLSADIAKMYRQILVDSCHCPLQRIFWRKSPSEPLKILELNTVTYGTASAPYLATRSLLQLAYDERDKYPLAARVVEKNFYVDNALFGSDTFEEAREYCLELIELLKSGGMHLHKWSSNDEKLLQPIALEDRDSYTAVGDCEANDIIKTLGLMWNPVSDEFIFVCQPPIECDRPTKRQVLSTIAKIFDPLGLISPVVVLAKILMQKLWISKLGWDDSLDGELYTQWKHFLTSLPISDQIRIPRQVLISGAVSYQLHGFSDASQAAYGACVYIRSLQQDGTATMRLVSSKSKIAPITPMTIPRKELLAALLLSRLTRKILTSIDLCIESVNHWCDSQVVLAWLRKSPQSLPIFVRNRTAEINNSKEFVWRYVRTTDNPADIVSRGQSAAELAVNDTWWNGPDFLRYIDYQMCTPEPLQDCDIPELKAPVIVHIAMNYDEFPILTKYESFRKTQRIVAYMLRFASNARKNRENRIVNPFLTVVELREALKTIVGAIQSHEFAKEIECVARGDPEHRLNNLNPFIEENLLRVGGRIRHASHLPYDSKHQLLLPNTSQVTRSLISAIHRENLHVGPAGVLAILKHQFWVLKPRSTIRQVLRKCIVCFKTKPYTIDQQMGDLPFYRLNPSPTFQRVGIDFAGPILIKQSARRAVPVKGYICVFVCMATKAMHLEAVEDLSTEAFLSAFKRFVARRGIPETVFSDNGTNFIGARSELHQLYILFKEDSTQQKIFEYCQVKEIEWKTIPPSAPHFGGIWEAGVKSVKSVLKKVYKSASLPIMEFSTLLCQIEAILNSRPLFAHSSDPNDLEALTPGHFIINRPLTSVPEPSCAEIPTNRLSRWQHIQKLREHFWKRWSREYVTELQVRTKWLSQRTNVQPNMIVLVKEDNLPPQSWRIGRVTNVYPGPDGLVRVVDVKTKTGIFRRPIHKLAPLPIIDNSAPTELESINSTFAKFSVGENVQSERGLKKPSSSISEIR
ncbi:uncharacterized protein LOC131694869 [Topomyia yanbarensis]|uniref:uncharacterized protein LOC131694869 n=1 Tax=Topomyia yanbarensis TaxID=2498891 RepID=UPI00273C6149|nr:uncharacterized protein LOC131694869 [Topomyia yanbarensis]